MFNSLLAEYKTPFGAVAAGEELSLRFALPTGDGRTPELLLYRAGQALPLLRLPLSPSEDGYRLRYTPAEPGLYYYGFRLSDGTLLHRAPDGSADYGEGPLWQLTVYDKNYSIPQKFAGQVMYQIFPDRFCSSGRPKPGVPADRRLHRDWQEEPQSVPDADGVFRCNDYFGGDLAGITQKLPELAALGVRVLYLNPIFEAHSNHRYNTADYLRIDPLLGDEQDFVTLCQTAHRWDIKIILDGVFNHTGSASRYFNADGFYPELGAAQSKDSPYYNWYHFTHWPDSYDAWWGIKTLPAVEENQASYRDFIIRSEDSVVRHWLRCGADGWRLDVADELPDDFIAELRQAMDAEKPDCLLLGEVWEDGSNKIAYDRRRKYLLGRETHGLMNYPFRTAALDWLCGGDAAAFRESMEQLRENYPSPAFYSAMNFLSTHDTPRILTLLGGEPTPADKAERAAAQLSPAGRELARRRLMLGALLLYTFPGSPTVYYGDEAGMEGYEDPLNRRAFPWGAEDEGLLRWYRRLGQLRGGRPSLQRGDICYLYADGSGLALRRQWDSEVTTAAMNSGKEPLTMTLSWPHPIATDAMTGQQFLADHGAVRLTLPPVSGVLLV